MPAPGAFRDMVARRQGEIDRERNNRLYGGPTFRGPGPKGPGDIGPYQDLFEDSVEAYGDIAGADLRREIGSTLGGLNSIGALRSGAVPVELGEISERYADRIGNYAAMTTGDAVGAAFTDYGLRRGVFESDRDVFLDEEERRRRSRSGLLRGIGSALGAGLGFVAGGPPGAAAGASAGGALGGGIGG